LTLIHLAFQSRSNFHCCFTPAEILFLFTAMSLDGKQRMARQSGPGTSLGVLGLESGAAGCNPGRQTLPPTDCSFLGRQT
jgi:hypothetical protein